MRPATFPAPSALFALAALLVPSPARAGARLENLDLASLYDAAKLIVLVDDFKTAGPGRAGTGTVHKVYKGQYPLAEAIHIIPWATDLERARGLGEIELPRRLTAVFFLKRQQEGHATGENPGSPWGMLPSGVRAIVEDRVLGVTPSSGHFILTPARSESAARRASGPYDHAELERDMAEARKRVYAVSRALKAAPSAEVRKYLKTLLGGEVRRVFERGRLQRSDLVLQLAGRLAELGELETLWRLRKRVPRERMGRKIEAFIAQHCEMEFILEALASDADEPRRNEMLRFLGQGAQRLDNRLKKVALERVLDLLPALRGSPRLEGCAAAAELFRRIPLEPSDAAFGSILRLLRQGDADVTFHLGAALADKRPDLANSILEIPSKLFALVKIDHSARKALRGRILLQRLASGSSFERPRLVVEHIEEGEKLLVERRELAVKLPENLLGEGKSGTAARSFSFTLETRPLSRGLWRVSLNLSWKRGEATTTWRSGPTEFRVEGN